MIANRAMLSSVLLAVTFTLGGSVAGQRTPPAPAGSSSTYSQAGEPHEKEETMRLEERQAKVRNDERQRRLVADTEKLLTLATALHEDVAKTNKNVLSLDVIRRAEEIEKLAHGVKERMKG